MRAFIAVAAVLSICAALAGVRVRAQCTSAHVPERAAMTCPAGACNVTRDGGVTVYVFAAPAPTFQFPGKFDFGGESTVWVSMDGRAPTQASSQHTPTDMTLGRHGFNVSCTGLPTDATKSFFVDLVPWLDTVTIGALDTFKFSFANGQTPMACDLNVCTYPSAQVGLGAPGLYLSTDARPVALVTATATAVTTGFGRCLSNGFVQAQAQAADGSWLGAPTLVPLGVAQPTQVPMVASGVQPADESKFVVLELRSFCDPDKAAPRSKPFIIRVPIWMPYLITDLSFPVTDFSPRFAKQQFGPYSMSTSRATLRASLWLPPYDVTFALTIGGKVMVKDQDTGYFLALAAPGLQTYSILWGNGGKTGDLTTYSLQVERVPRFLVTFTGADPTGASFLCPDDCVNKTVSVTGAGLNITVLDPCPTGREGGKGCDSMAPTGVFVIPNNFAQTGVKVSVASPTTGMAPACAAGGLVTAGFTCLTDALPVDAATSTARVVLLATTATGAPHSYSFTVQTQCEVLDRLVVNVPESEGDNPMRITQTSVTIPVYYKQATAAIDATSPGKTVNILVCDRGVLSACRAPAGCSSGAQTCSVPLDTGVTKVKVTVQKDRPLASPYVLTFQRDPFLSAFKLLDYSRPILDRSSGKYVRTGYEEAQCGSGGGHACVQYDGGRRRFAGATSAGAVLLQLEPDREATVSEPVLNLSPLLPMSRQILQSGDNFITFYASSNNSWSSAPLVMYQIKLTVQSAASPARTLSTCTVVAVLALALHHLFA